MPSSAKDRMTVDFEHIFFFVKNRKYWFETQYESYKNPIEANIIKNAHTKNRSARLPGHGNLNHKWSQWRPNPNGRIKRATWKIPTQSYKDAHFAVFPEQLVETPLKAGCPLIVCSICGDPHKPEFKTTKVDPVEVYTGQATKDYDKAKAQNPSDTKRRVLESMRNIITDVQYVPQCRCNNGTSPGIVLDPFVGSGTTCVVAKKLGRSFVGIDLQPDYCSMANKRLMEML